MTSQSAPKPTDPALSLGLDNATQQALTSTHTHTHAGNAQNPNPSLLFFSHEHDPHLYIRLEVEQVDLLPVAAI